MPKAFAARTCSSLLPEWPLFALFVLAGVALAAAVEVAVANIEFVLDFDETFNELGFGSSWVTGATGSGSTTVISTLYSAFTASNSYYPQRVQSRSYHPDGW